MLWRIFGLHGTGKTAWLYERLAGTMRAKKHAFLIVPEQSAVIAERTLIDTLGNPANRYVEVINFKRLCNRVARACGGLVTETPDKAAMLMAMAHVCESLHDSLHAYAPEASDADFAAKMLDTVNAMRQSRVTSETLDSLLADAADIGGKRLCDKLHDISLIAAGFDAYLSETLEFPGDRLDKLYETLCTFDFFQGYTVYVDGFYGFTAQELAILERVIRTAEDTYITFVCENERVRDRCFARATDAASRLGGYAAKYGVPKRDVYLTEFVKYGGEPVLTHIARHFSYEALAACEASEPTDALQVIRCGNIYDEAACAVRIVSDLLCKGVRPRDIAVCAADPNEYAGILDSLFCEASIPFSFDTKEDLSATPLASLVLSAFDVAFGYEGHDVIACVKTGLTGLTDEEGDLLEQYIRTWHISGKGYFHTPFVMHPDGFTEDAPDTERLDVISRAKDALLAIFDGFADALEKAENGTALAAAVWTLIEDCRRLSGRDTFDDGNGGRDLDLLCRVLDNIDVVLGTQPIKPARFRALLSLALSEASVGKLPELLDQVRFGSASLMRTDDVSYVLLLGVNDGVFPASAKKDTLLTDEERRTLGNLGAAFLAPDEDAAYDGLFLAYTTLTAAKKQAYVLYRSLTMSEEPCYPSVVVSVLSGLVAFDAPKEFDAAAPENHTYSHEALFGAYLSMPRGGRRTALGRYFAALPAYADRVRRAEAVTQIDEPLDAALCEKLYGERLVSSYTRLQQFAKCPYAYFCNSTLKLRPEPEATLGALENGNIVHEALEHLIHTLAERHEKGIHTDHDTLKAEVTAELTAILHKLLPRAESSGAHTKRFDYLLYRLTDTLCLLCESYMAECEVSDFKPIGFELPMSEDGGVKPLDIPLSDGRTLSVIGKIDRVDVYRSRHDGKSYLRVIDYKTGKKTFELKNIHAGLDLQMLLYLNNLVRQSFGGGKTAPAGVLYVSAAPPEAKPVSLSEAAEEKEHDGVKIQTSGLIVKDEDIVFAMDRGGSGRFIPVTPKGDSLPDTDTLMSAEEYAALLDETVAQTGKAGEWIMHGEKSAKDVRGTGSDACAYCEMKDLCMSKM